MHIIDILRGSKVAKILQFNHQNLSVYGIAKNKNKNEWNAIVDRLLDLEAIFIGEFKALKISPLGYEILKGKTKVLIDEDKIGQIQKDKSKTSQQIYDINMEHYDKFKDIRATLANEQNVPSYMIFSDKVLVELSSTLPINKEQMLLVNGIGEVKYERYGEIFQNLCKSIKNKTNEQ